MRGMDYTAGPLTPALTPSDGEREKQRLTGMSAMLRTP